MGAPPHEYAYHERGWLTDVWLDGELVEHYEYDGNGNRLSLTTPTGVINATYDEQDRLLSYGDVEFSYAENGELWSKTDTATGDVTTYAYDALGNLLSVELPDGRLIEYLIDGRSRRVGKLINGTLVKQWLYKDRLNPVAELDGAGNVTAQFVYGSKPHVPDYVVRGSESYRVISDYLGSPVLAVNIADDTDTPFEAEYTGFGDVTGTGLDWMPFGFAGGIYDPDTGLVRFGARDYDPVTGRWTTKDSIRFAGGGPNLYVYVDNDPVNRRDPSGLTDWEFCYHMGLNESEWCMQQCLAESEENSGWLNQLCSLFGLGFDLDECLRDCARQTEDFVRRCMERDPQPIPLDSSTQCRGDQCLALRQ